MDRTKTTVEYFQETKMLARFAKALAHPARIKIIKYLSEQSYCHTGDLTDYLPLAQSTISQHLKELKEAGLIKGQINPPKVKYCIQKQNWEKAKVLFCDLFDIDVDSSACDI
jgi:predicted transcriptional regulator